MKAYLKFTGVILTAVTLQSSTAFGFGIGAMSGDHEYGNPVHEAITRAAAVDSRYASQKDLNQITQLVEGVRFNDDPKAYIAKGNLLKFAFKFLGSNTSKTDVTEAFHFGDYQFMHAMAKADTPASKVKNHMMVYAYHCWISATEPDSFTKFQKTYANIKQKLKNNAPNSDYDREELIMKDMVANFSSEVLFYNAEDQESFQNRALGSLLHMVQDSYAKGHSVRVGWESASNDGAIRYFQAYEEQDSSGHKHYDIPKSGDVDAKTVLEIPGAKAAYLRSKQILEMAVNKCPWTSASLNEKTNCTQSMYSFLSDEVFKLAPEATDEAKGTHSHQELLKKEPAQNQYN